MKPTYLKALNSVADASPWLTVNAREGNPFPCFFVIPLSLYCMFLCLFLILTLFLLFLLPLFFVNHFPLHAFSLTHPHQQQLSFPRLFTMAPPSTTCIFSPWISVLSPAHTPCTCICTVVSIMTLDQKGAKMKCASQLVFYHGTLRILTPWVVYTLSVPCGYYHDYYHW